jgi:hypothetical protein
MLRSKRVTRVLNASTTLVLAAAVFVLPLALDQCVVACEAHREAAVASAPACHHTAPPALGIGRSPAPCGHDHDSFVASTAAAPAAQRILAHTWVLAISVSQGMDCPDIDGRNGWLPAGNPPDPLSARSNSLSLRI